MKIAFVANLDAECELMAPATYRPSSRMVAAMTARATALQFGLGAALRATLQIVVPGQPARAADDFAAGLCWCPTPAALTVLRMLGAPVPAAPPLDVLQRVNHRAFAAAIAPQLPGAHFVRSLAELQALLAEPRPALGYLLKRPFGFSGRGRKRVAAEQPFAGALHTWAAASMQAYGIGLQVEPWMRIDADFALHGFVRRRGPPVFGDPTRQHVDAHGAWLASERASAPDLHAAEREALQDTAARVASALQAAHYFGPFGLDAYRYRDAADRLGFHPLSEINARLSMGFVVGMGERATALLATA